MLRNHMETGVQRFIFPFALVLLASLFLAGSALAKDSAEKPVQPTAPLASCDSAWKIVPTSNLDSAQGTFDDIAMLSENDIWAVGNYSAGSFAYPSGIVTHWNGTTLSRVDVPSLNQNTVEHISVVSDNDIWLQGEAHHLTHWDGTTWIDYAQFPVPIYNQYWELTELPIKSIKAFSPTDVWAFGFAHWRSTEGEPDEYYDYVIHWDGTQWNPTDCRCGPFLRDVSAISANDMWVLGHDTGAGYNVNHWNGLSWTGIGIPGFGTYQLRLNDLKVISDNDIWTVGYSAVQGSETPIALHWNGTDWQNTTLPVSESARLFAVGGSSSNNIYAVGDAGCGDYVHCIQVGSLVLHWNGTQWSRISDAPLGSMRTVAALSSGSTWIGGSLGRPWLEHYTGFFNDIPTNLTGERSNVLNGVAAISSNDVWAVGSYDRSKSTDGTVLRTLTQHWDGTSWSIIPSPNPPIESVLSAVSAISSTDVWAVGHSLDNGPHDLVEHWDGTQWSIVPVPPDGNNTSELYGVTAIAPNDVWAVGVKTVWPAQIPKMLHWDGTEWTDYSTLGYPAYLNSISAVSANDIWAVGHLLNGDGPVVVHWDGTAWSGIPGPTNTGELFSMSALSDTDVWAVGRLVTHFDGTSWQNVDLPPIAQPTFTSIVANADGVWVAGYHLDTNGKKRTISLYYDYHTWVIQSSEDVGANDNELKGIAVINATDVWSVGTYSTDSAQRTLAEHFPTLFTDTLPGSTFYPYVQCLLCQGIIDGYADGTFRPNNPLTRGQLAKIVSNAAAFNEESGAQQYEDVLPGSTFYDYIWRLSNRGFMAGYACGGAAEPCGPGNLPYFRPNGTATRGQISKIVSNAAGYNDPPGDQSFADVLPGSTFYDYVQRLALHNVMGGYPCGGPGEPCGSGNLPYFRPSNNATRGQTSKIITLTFFPTCSRDMK